MLYPFPKTTLSIYTQERKSERSGREAHAIFLGPHPYSVKSSILHLGPVFL